MKPNPLIRCDRPEYDATETKVCRKCGGEFPATEEFFQPVKQYKNGLFSWCRECRRKQMAAARDKHQPEVVARREDRERLAALGLKRCTLCGEALPADTDHFAADRGLRARCKKCSSVAAQRLRGEHKSRVEYARAYYQRNKEKYRKHNHEYNAAHREEAAAYTRNYKAKKKANGGTHSAEDIAAQLKRQKGKCYWCGVKLGDKYHVDHVTPISLGGSNGPENLVVACVPCNQSKCAKHPMDWAGRLL